MKWIPYIFLFLFSNCVIGSDSLDKIDLQQVVKDSLKTDTINNNRQHFLELEIGNVNVIGLEVFFLNSNSTYAQSDTIKHEITDDTTVLFKNNISLELGGTGLLYSFKYERVLLGLKKLKMAGIAGLGYWWVDSFNSAHVMVSYIGLDFKLENVSKFTPSIGIRTAFSIDPFAKQHSCPGATKCPTSARFHYVLDAGLGYEISDRIEVKVSFDIISMENEIYYWGGLALGYEF